MSLSRGCRRSLSLFSQALDGSYGGPRKYGSEKPPVPLQILGRVEELHKTLQPLNDRLRGPLERNSHKTTALPFVLLLGNHSSGKSSFVNYVLGRDIQTAGVAPTDDSFTIIAPGDTDVDQDGPALVGDPDMGFNGLRHFGPALIHHMRLKIRTETSTSNFMLADTPGMIDSPIDRQGGMLIDRGYDFEGTVRWFAERSDVILLFFDVRNIDFAPRHVSAFSFCQQVDSNMSP